MWWFSEADFRCFTVAMPCDLIDFPTKFCKETNHSVEVASNLKYYDHRVCYSIGSWNHCKITCYARAGEGVTRYRQGHWRDFRARMYLQIRVWHFPFLSPLYYLFMPFFHKFSIICTISSFLLSLVMFNYYCFDVFLLKCVLAFQLIFLSHFFQVIIHTLSCGFNLFMFLFFQFYILWQVLFYFIFTISCLLAIDWIYTTGDLFYWFKMTKYCVTFNNARNNILNL